MWMSRLRRRTSPRWHTPGMRRSGFLLVAVALCGAFVFGTAVTGSSAAVSREAAKPRLMLVDTDPVTFRGVGFKAGERVQLTAADGGRTVRRSATTASAGTFTMLVPGVNAND